MRNNERRITEFVELPSKGRFDPEGHPLHNQETVEIKFMTTKEEDILSSQSLLKNGLALDRLIESLSVGDIDARSLLLGDRSAILVAARISGYGSEYNVSLRCEHCLSFNEVEFDLHEHSFSEGCLDKTALAEKGVVYNDNTQTLDVSLPTTGVDVGVRLLNGGQESDLTKAAEDGESVVTTLLQSIMVKVNQNTDPNYVKDFIEIMPAKDSKFLRNLYPELVPTVKMEHEFQCSKCYNGQNKEVPLTAEFFWPE